MGTRLQKRMEARTRPACPMRDEHVDRPCLAGPTATWEPSDRAGEPCPRTTGRSPPTAEAKLRPPSAKGNKTNRIAAAGQRAQHGKRSPCRARSPLTTRPEIWSAHSSRPHARTAPGSPLWSQCTGRNVVPVLGRGLLLPTNPFSLAQRRARVDLTPSRFPMELMQMLA